MNFQFSDEEKILHEQFKLFIKKEIEPIVNEIEENGITRNIFKKLSSIGYLGCIFPKKYNGSGLTYLSYAPLQIELAKASASIFLSTTASVILFGGTILLSGTEEQKKRLLPKVASGDLIGAFCLTEPHSGSDVASIKTKAEKKNGKYILNGNKMFITNGTIADKLIVFASTNKEKKHKGITAFIVDKNTKGVSSSKPFKKLGARGSPTSEIILEDVEVSDADVLGGVENQGFYQAMKTLEIGRLGMTAYILGITEACLDECLNYAGQREAFGKKIASFEEIHFKIADMKMWIDTGKMLFYKAAWLNDINHKDAGLFSSISKLFISEHGVQIASDALQIFGGYGYINEYKIERLYRDIKLGDIGEGTSEIQRRIIFRNLAKTYNINI